MTKTSTTRSLWQTGSLAPGASSKRDKKSLRRPAIFAFFIFEIICFTLLQKIVFPLDFGTMGGPVEAILPLTYAALFVLVFFVRIKVDMNRLILLSIFLLLAFLSIMTLTGSYSPNSVLLMIAIYLPFILYIEVSEATFLDLMKLYLNAMIFFGGVVVVQHLTQLIWSWRLWPNLNQLVPPSFLFDGFVYLQPIKYGSPYMKPNAVCFLEVSYVSQWTAIALAIELVYFRRLWRMIFYSVILISCFAGTGLLLLLVTAPVLLSRVSRRTIFICFVVGLAVFVTAIGINWLPQVQQRFLEVFQTGASANHRFVVPFQVLAESSQHLTSLYSGEGPGSGVKINNEFWWVVTKLAFEYGYLTTIAFFIFFGYVIFNGAASQRISFMMLIFFNFMGGFIIPVYPLFIFMMVGMFRIRTPKPA